MKEQTNESFVIDHLPSRTITHEGKPYLFFSGTAYLGLPQHPAFQQLLIDGIARYGTTFGSSRNGNLRLGIYEEAEAKLTAVVGAPHALTVSSGMLAGQVVVNWLRSKNTTFVYGPQTHPALWNGPGVDLPIGPFSEWAAQLTDTLRSSQSGPVAILTNSIDAIRSQYYDFNWISELPGDRPITIVIDDSHGLGVLNPDVRLNGCGPGVWPQIPQKSNVNLIVTGSLAKAMGLPGGVIFADADTLGSLRQTAFFGACSPMPPAYLDAFINADALYAEGRRRLQQNVLMAERLLLPTGLFSHAIGYPLFFTEQDSLYPFLLERGVFVYSFAYPTAADRANTRLIISAFHEPADIETLAKVVGDFLK